ncbi:hypothetical protein IHE45_20G013200 [Dioscorea alata]|uniref:Uncharacterized protein n=1 Tax=Dioscorea alata TaxID=55571 RepID=A0ACB7TSE7_DIOAL|nr:hypothetical protein IHE45_20G013200 [Dioscorea alata]
MARGTPEPRRGRQGTVGARPWCNGRVSAAPTRRAEGHDALGRAKPGRPGDGRHHRESGSVARPPAKVRVAHRQPPGRAMSVRAMSRARGGAARANPRHTRPRGTPAPHRGRRGTVGARPLCKGGLARNHHTVVGGDRGTTRTARQNRAADGRAAPPLARPRCPVTGLGPGGPRAATQTRHGRARHVPSY